MARPPRGEGTRRIGRITLRVVGQHSQITNRHLTSKGPSKLAEFGLIKSVSSNRWRGWCGFEQNLWQEIPENEFLRASRSRRRAPRIGRTEGPQARPSDPEPMEGEGNPG
jgi:hypothetical protein